MISRHPGGIIRRRYIDPLQLSLSALADAMGVNVSSVSRVVNEKADLTSEMAMRISYVLGGTPEMWMGLQTDFNLTKAKAAFDPAGLKRLNPDAGRAIGA
ncbi:HigA family addiction module antitoxin [Pseudomonas sp.]|uniref:HigA family addiction module antitoxin n=1 Tax=Pseudomonas sp. TaxID=306 RepID=UPI002C641AB3|nr:HigA family addiction module antitoxin [Pseudomonas sp.]HUE91863.1 HigA family addiction module antitoxin [Pseudomonas sp.]